MNDSLLQAVASRDVALAAMQQELQEEQDRVIAIGAELIEAQRERDEARAEVERLRGGIAAAADLLDGGAILAAISHLLMLSVEPRPTPAPSGGVCPIHGHSADHCRVIGCEFGASPPAPSGEPQLSDTSLCGHGYMRNLCPRCGEQRYLTPTEQQTTKRALRSSSRLIAEDASPPAPADLVERARPTDADIARGWEIVNTTPVGMLVPGRHLAEKIAQERADVRADATRQERERHAVVVHSAKGLLNLNPEHCAYRVLLPQHIERLRSAIRALAGQPQPDAGGTK